MIKAVLEVGVPTSTDSDLTLRMLCKRNCPSRKDRDIFYFIRSTQESQLEGQIPVFFKKTFAQGLEISTNKAKLNDKERKIEEENKRS